MNLRQKVKQSKNNQYEVVNVDHLFSDLEDGETYEARLYPLSVLENVLLHQRVNSECEKAGIASPTAENIGAFYANSIPFRVLYNSILVALTTRDDNGRLIFGENYSDAIEYVLSLPKEKGAAISEIAAAIIFKREKTSPAALEKNS